MALIACWECGKQISDTAMKCPHCGAANRKVSRASTFYIVAILIAFVVWLLMASGIV